MGRSADGQEILYTFISTWSIIQINGHIDRYTIWNI